MRKNEVVRQNPLNPDECWCISCKQFKDKSLFTINKTKKNGHSIYCRKCYKMYVDRRNDGGAYSVDAVNRGTIKGFIKYFENNKYLFRELYKKNFTEELATQTFHEIKGIKVDCNDFIPDNDRYGTNKGYRAPHL